MDEHYGNTFWNDDPEWAAYITKYEGVIGAIAAKSTTDIAIRQDCEQEARLGLLSVFPENISGFEKYIRGEITQAEWDQNLDRYCRNVIRNAVLSYLESPKTGNWRIGRTKRVLNKKTGKRIKKYEPPRYSSLDELVEEGGLQVDDEGAISWLNANTDGLDLSDYWTEQDYEREDIDEDFKEN